jgi:hypothetical protein
MGTVYRVTHVRFVEKMPNAPDRKNIIIEEKQPERNGFLRDEVKKSLIKLISAECQRANKSMVVVFDVKECVYCEPDGTTLESTNPPSGGIDLFGTFDQIPTVPDGLTQCEKCGHFKGDCQWNGQSWKISCVCNRQICHKCHEPVNKYQIASKIFEPTDGRCWHIPIFCAWGHTCPNGEKGQLENSFLINFKTGENVLHKYFGKDKKDTNN